MKPAGSAGISPLLRHLVVFWIRSHVFGIATRQDLCLLFELSRHEIDACVQQREFPPPLRCVPGTIWRFKHIKQHLDSRLEIAQAVQQYKTWREQGS